MAIVFLGAFVGMVALAWGLATGASAWGALILYSLTGAVTVLLLAWVLYLRKNRRRSAGLAERPPGSSEINSSQ